MDGGSVDYSIVGHILSRGLATVCSLKYLACVLLETDRATFVET